MACNFREIEAVELIRFIDPERKHLRARRLRHETYDKDHNYLDKDVKDIDKSQDFMNNSLIIDD